MNLANWLVRTAAVNGGKPALFHGRKPVADYATFARQAACIGAALVAQGVMPGDRVAIFLKNTPEYLAVKYGIWFAGAAAVPINAKLHGKEAAWIIENAGATLVFTSLELQKELVNAGVSCPQVDVFGADYQKILDTEPLPEVVSRQPDDLAWLFYTSGTTGKPKGVIVSHGMLVAMSLSYFVDADQVKKEDTTLYAAPLSHGAGIYSMMHVLVGAGHVFPPSGGFDEAEIFKLAKHFGSVHMFAAPTMVKRMTEVAKSSGKTGEGLRTVVYAGGPMYLADIVDAVEHLGPIFVQIYGQGECPMSITALSRADVAERDHPRWRERVSSVGRAQSVVEVMIGDENGVQLPHGEIGEILVRGEPVMPGYWQNDAATAKAFVNDWLLTGDMGFMDRDGYLTMKDRSKDMIISGGSNIYPREVEEVLLSHEGVSEASVVGRENPDWGEDVVAFVVKTFDSSVSEDELDALCLAQIARFKRPKTYFWVQELPKNNYGKVLKTVLRDRLASSI